LGARLSSREPRGGDAGFQADFEDRGRSLALTERRADATEEAFPIKAQTIAVACHRFDE
jgi:hypothetical protein